MKLIKFAVALAATLAYGQAFAFHSGGVAECEGCHSMHNSFEGSANVERPADTNGYAGQVWRAYGTGSGPALLKANSQSGACLNCHEPGTADTAPSSYHISTVGIVPYDASTPVEMTPGGDFAWLKKTMNVTVRGTATANGNEGDRHGHNIVAVDFGYNADKTNTVAPNAQTQGVGYPAGNLACSSCHDPHGRYRRDASGGVTMTGLPIFNSGSYSNSAAPIPGVSAVGVYRILGGVGYQPVSLTGSFAFTAPPPAAVAPSTYNRSESASQTHVVYGSGMSEWCGNCHAGMHNDTVPASGIIAAGSVHPAGNGAKLTATIIANYNSYVSSGIMTNTDKTKAYSTLAPFEMGNGQTLNDYTAMKALAVNTDTLDQSASATANVMCLSCHRAHASAFESMTRYMLSNEFMTIADSTNAAAYDPSATENKINQGYSVNQQTSAYYGRPASKFGPYARDYCNKCHAKD
jgi:predicted CXXCH cytochrome family protein